MYVDYTKAVGVMTFVLMTLVYIFFQASVTFSAIWLSRWTDDELLANTSAAGSTEFVNKNYMYLGVYGALGVAQGRFIALEIRMI